MFYYWIGQVAVDGKWRTCPHPGGPIRFDGFNGEYCSFQVSVNPKAKSWYQISLNFQGSFYVLLIMNFVMTFHWLYMVNAPPLVTSMVTASRGSANVSLATMVMIAVKVSSIPASSLSPPLFRSSMPLRDSCGLVSLHLQFLIGCL